MVGQHRDCGLGIATSFRERRAHFATVRGYEFACGLLPDVKHGNVEAACNQVRSHRRTHVADTDKAYLHYRSHPLAI